MTVDFIASCIRMPINTAIWLARKSAYLSTYCPHCTHFVPCIVTSVRGGSAVGFFARTLWTGQTGSHVPGRDRYLVRRHKDLCQPETLACTSKSNNFLCFRRLPNASFGKRRLREFELPLTFLAAHLSVLCQKNLSFRMASIEHTHNYNIMYKHVLYI